MKSSRLPLVLVVQLSVIVMSGCASLRTESAFKLQEAERLGLPTNVVKRTNAATAGSLNLLPGVGNIYLACTSDKWYNWLIFPVNAVTWPLSIAWGVPQTAIDANTVNKEATADYYTLDPQGRARFEAATNTKGP